MLYTMIRPSRTEVVVPDAESVCVDDEEIDLLGTDDEADMDYESEHDSDRDFVNDVEMSEEEDDEVSFYRRFDNDF